eukprot:1759975-Amphidinium_carterae.1
MTIASALPYGSAHSLNSVSCKASMPNEYRAIDTCVYYVTVRVTSDSPELSAKRKWITWNR